jgi:DNA-directed RNA polymerase subunit K/omega
MSWWKFDFKFEIITLHFYQRHKYKSVMDDNDFVDEAFADDGDDFDDDVGDEDETEIAEPEPEQEVEPDEGEDKGEEDGEEAEEDGDEEEEAAIGFEPDDEFLREKITGLGLGAESDVDQFHQIVDQRRKMVGTTVTSSMDPSHRLTKYELAAVIGYRAQQIAEGAQPYVKVAENTDPITIAIDEFDHNLIPFMIERPYPSNKIGRFKYETFRLDELTNVLSVTK